MSHAGPSTAALHTSGTTKRLSTHAKIAQAGGKAGPSSGLAGAGGGAGVGLGKEVLNPGELCGFVSPDWLQVKLFPQERPSLIIGRHASKSTGDAF